jgi:hypothetical protein
MNFKINFSEKQIKDFLANHKTSGNTDSDLRSNNLGFAKSFSYSVRAHK